MSIIPDLLIFETIKDFLSYASYYTSSIGLVDFYKIVLNFHEFVLV